MKNSTGRREFCLSTFALALSGQFKVNTLKDVSVEIFKAENIAKSESLQWFLHALEEPRKFLPAEVATTLDSAYYAACDIVAARQVWADENDPDELRVSQFFANLAASVIAPHYARLAGLDTIAVLCERGVDIRTVLHHPDLAVDAHMLNDNEDYVLTSTLAYAQACGALSFTAGADAIATGRFEPRPHRWAAGEFCGRALMQGYYYEAPPLPFEQSAWIGRLVLYAIREAQILDPRCCLSPVNG